MMVSSHGVLGRRSLPQVKASSITTPLACRAIVAAVEGEITARAASAISEMRIAPDQPSGELLGVRVEQELVRMKRKPCSGS